MHRLDSHVRARSARSSRRRMGVGFAASGSVATPAAIDDGKATEHELVAAVIRHAGFLWQVSGAAYNDDAFLERAIARYERFVRCARARGGLLGAADRRRPRLAHAHPARRGLRGGERGDARRRGRARPRQRRGHVGGRAPRRGAGAHARRVARRQRRQRRPRGRGRAVGRAAPRRAAAVVVRRRRRRRRAGRRRLPRRRRDRRHRRADARPVRGRRRRRPGGVTGGRGHGKDARALVEVDARLEGRIKAAVSRGLGMARRRRRDEATPSRPRRTTAARRPPAAPATLPARVAVGKMGLHRDRLAVKQGGGEAMLADRADGYIAVVYLSTGGTLVLEPDAAPGEGDAAWVPTPLARREVAVEAGRLVAWPNYAYKHGAELAGGDATRWILGPVAIVSGRAHLAQSLSNCGGGGEIPGPSACESAVGAKSDRHRLKRTMHECLDVVKHCSVVDIGGCRTQHASAARDGHDAAGVQRHHRRCECGDRRWQHAVPVWGLRCAGFKLFGYPSHEHVTPAMPLCCCYWFCVAKPDTIKSINEKLQPFRDKGIQAEYLIGQEGNPPRLSCIRLTLRPPRAPSARSRCRAARLA